MCVSSLPDGMTYKNFSRKLDPFLGWDKFWSFAVVLNHETSRWSPLRHLCSLLFWKFLEISRQEAGSNAATAKQTCWDGINCWKSINMRHARHPLAWYLQFCSIAVRTNHRIRQSNRFETLNYVYKYAEYTWRKNFSEAILSIKQFLKKRAARFFFVDHRFGCHVSYLPARLYNLPPKYPGAVTKGYEKWHFNPNNFCSGKSWVKMASASKIFQFINIQIWYFLQKNGTGISIDPLSMTPCRITTLTQQKPPFVHLAFRFHSSPWEPKKPAKIIQKSPPPLRKFTPTFIQFEAPGWKPEDLLIPPPKWTNDVPMKKKDHVLKRKIQSLPTKITVQGTC